MKVELLAYTPQPERTVAAAAKICYSAADDIEAIFDGLDEAKTASYVDMIASLGHESVIEHTSFTFGLEGVSRALLAEITRHRIASFSVQSQRYVRKGSFAYVTPPAVAELPEAEAEFAQAMREAQAHYDRLAEMLKKRHETAYLQSGMDAKAAAQKAEKRAIEDARFVLPNACDTRMIFTMNARSLHNFFRLRCCERAQWEIRAAAWEMLRLCLGVAPRLFRTAGPACVRGACGEGKMSCGQAEAVRARARALRGEAGAMEKT